MTQLAFEEPRTFTCCSAPFPEDLRSRPSDHAPDCTNPNLGWFDEAGNPRHVLWCGDEARMTRVCPYVGDRARFRPKDCCLDIEKRAA